MEHASIASFNRFALQLLALGAPSRLVTAALDAARDGSATPRSATASPRGTRACRTGGKLELPIAPLAVDPVTVALETLRDGCIGESAAAELALEASRNATEPEVAGALASVAADEANHAELAWRTIAWLVAEYGEPVRSALAARAAELAGESGAGAAPEEDPSPHGVLGARRQLACRSAVLREIALPCLEALV